MNNKCLVTLVIGDSYVEEFKKYYERTWQNYALKHGYDLVIIDKPLDAAGFDRRSPHWQKLLVLEHPEVARYEHAVWVDADILINYHTAPCVVEANSSDKIGAVFSSLAHPLPSDLDNVLHRQRAHCPAEWARNNPTRTHAERYALAGLPDDVNDMINTGVLVTQPKRHADVFRYVYDNYTENRFSAKENVPLSYHLFKHDLLNHIDERFNMQWDEYFFGYYPFLMIPTFKKDIRLAALCVNTAFHNNWFLHFLGGSTRPFVGLVIPDYHWSDAWQVIEHHFADKYRAIDG